MKEILMIYLIINSWQDSISKICYKWPNNAITHECAQRMSELQYYFVMSDNEIHQLVIVFIT